MGGAHAFWLREPGAGEIRPVALARARRPTRSSSAPCARGSAVAPRRWCSAARCRPSQYAAMRAPFQDGEFPGPVKYGYLNVGVVEQGPALAARAHGLLPVPAPEPLRRPGARRHASCPTASRRSGRCWPAPSRPRSTRCGTPRRCSATGSPSSAPAWSAAASPAWPPAVPGVQVELVDTDPTRAAVAAALGVDFASPAGAAGERDLVLHASASAAGLQRALELLRRRRHGRRAAAGTARASSISRSAGRSTRAGSAIRASQVGAVARGPARPPHAGRAARPGPRAAARSRVRRAAHRHVAVRRAARRAGRGWPPGRCPGCATSSPTTRWPDVQRDRPRPHDGRPQLPRRGLRPGAAAARRDLRGRRDVPPRRARPGQHRRRHRPGRASSCTRCWPS